MVLLRCFDAPSASMVLGWPGVGVVCPKAHPWPTMDAVGASVHLNSNISALLSKTKTLKDNHECARGGVP